MAYTSSQLNDAYIESIRRKDKKNNVYFVPMSCFDEKGRAFYPNSSYQQDIVFNNIYIDGRRLTTASFNGPLIFSLKEGKYRIKIDFVVNRSLSLGIMDILNKNPSHKIDSYSLKKMLNYKASKEATITVGSLGDTYVMFKAKIGTLWEYCQDSRSTVWSLKDYSHSYSLGQTDLRTISGMCSFWMGGKKTYSYPSVSEGALIEVLADQALARAKADRASVAKSTKTTTTTKTATTTKTTTTAKTTSTAAKPEFKRFDNAAGTYAGFVVNGKRHGHGMFKWKMGDMYDGEWVNDARTGDGVYYYASGAKFVGKFVNGKRHGAGVYTFKDGTVKRGVWKDDKFVG